MQETKKFKAADGKDVLVEVNSHEGNQSAVLIIHGFTGHINEHIFYNAANTWPKKGLDVWRISLYPGEIENTRKMAQVRWNQNLGDIDLALVEVQKSYENIFVVGHSMGGTAAIYSTNPNIRTKVLWDPSDDSDAAGVLDPELHPDYYTIDWGHTILAAKQYAHEAIAASKYEGALPIQPPLFVIRSSDHKPGWPQGKLKAKLSTIKDSDHCFNNEGNERELFRLTLNFFKKHNGAQNLC